MTDEDTIEALAKTLHKEFPNPLKLTIAVIGPAGSGKTTLANALMLPMLKLRGGDASILDESDPDTPDFGSREALRSRWFAEVSDHLVFPAFNLYVGEAIGVDHDMFDAVLTLKKLNPSMVRISMSKTWAPIVHTIEV